MRAFRKSRVLNTIKLFGEAHINRLNSVLAKFHSNKNWVHHQIDYSSSTLIKYYENLTCFHQSWKKQQIILKGKAKKRVPIPIHWPWAKHGTYVYFAVCPKFSVRGLQYKAVRHGCSIAGISYALDFGGAMCLIKYGDLWETTKTIPLGKIWFPPRRFDETKSSRIMALYGSALQINQLQSNRFLHDILWERNISNPKENKREKKKILHM